MRNLSAGRDGQPLAGGPPRIQGRANREGEPDTEAAREGRRGLRRAAVRGGYEQQIVNANQQALSSAVRQYKAAYAKELKQLPALLKTAKANAFPKAAAAS